MSAIVLGIRFGLLQAAAVGGAPACTPPPLPAAVVEYRNGRWWTGEGFESRTMYSAAGVLRFRAPASVDSVIDLAGGYVIPPFAEAHNHNLHSNYQVQETIARYLRDGVFYVATLSNLPSLTAEIRPLFNCATSVDVIFANGGITASGGHPIPLRERLLAMGAYPGFTKETLQDHGYYIADDSAGVERIVPQLLATRPDLVKIFLLYSDEYRQRRDDPRFAGQKGLSPALVPLLVARVRAGGLRVIAHVETAADFRVAVEAGVDLIAHLPGYALPTRIDSASASLAAARGIVVITTVGLSRRPGMDSTRMAAITSAQRDNLRLLKSMGVKVAVGSDRVEDTSTNEMGFLDALGVFSHGQLLNLWTGESARALFPARRIGALADGYEASFLVLEGNPLEDWSNLRRIVRRVKQGYTLRNFP
ncbi:MAG: amidohydrolase family protein [Gemmatimonadales bacterium]|nr:amidohydrolase family protein [Gemmatimonadales bacterium]